MRPHQRIYIFHPHFVRSVCGCCVRVCAVCRAPFMCNKRMQTLAMAHGDVENGENCVPLARRQRRPSYRNSIRFVFVIKTLTRTQFDCKSSQGLKTYGSNCLSNNNNCKIFFGLHFRVAIHYSRFSAVPRFRCIAKRVAAHELSFFLWPFAGIIFNFRSIKIFSPFIDGPEIAGPLHRRNKILSNLMQL